MIRSMRVSGPAVLMTLFGLAVAACGTSAQGEPPGRSGVPVWRLAAEPSVAIGVADGDPDHQLFRVSGAAVLADGSIVVANLGHASLSVYDAQGRFVRRLGRKGQGPGEFETLAWVGAAGDTVFAWDQRLQRVTAFGPGEAPPRVVSFEGVEGMFPEMVGRLSDGSFVLSPGPDMMAMMGAPRGLFRDSVRLTRYGADGRAAGPAGAFLGGDLFLTDRATGFTWHDAPLGRQTHLVAAGGALYAGDSGSGEIGVHGPDGGRTRTLRSPHARWKVTPDDAARFREERLAVMEDAERRGELEEMLEAAPFPETAPAFGAMTVDAEGYVWVQAYPRPGQEAVTWAVLSPEGAEIARIDIPARLKVLQAARGHVLALETDELGTERVLLFPVSQP